MNRGIKFRCWDKIINQMFVPSMINKDGDVRHDGISLTDNNLYIKGQKFETWLLKADRNFVLMEFTGLKDENGKEIYEGDIVIWEACSCEVRFGYHTVTVDDDGNITAAALGFYLYFINTKCDDPIDRNVNGNCEVIGNIYENPELFKKLTQEK